MTKTSKDATDKPASGGIGSGYYQEIQLSPSVEDARRLVFVFTRGAGKPPTELVFLRQEFERTARTVSVLFEDESKTRNELFLLLHQSAYSLVGAHFDVDNARSNLAEARDIVLDYAHRVRNNRLKQYTILLLIFGVLPLLLGAAVLQTAGFGWLRAPAEGKDYNALFAWVMAALWIPAGAAICVWGEFALRMQAGLSYDKLLELDPSRWNPPQRLLVTVVISFIFAFLLAFDTVRVGLGSLVLNDFITKTPAMGLAVGGITGLAFAAVQDIIFRMKPSAKGDAVRHDGAGSPRSGGPG